MSTSARSSPTNILWPSKRTWELFDLLLGGALVKTVPLAASCYSAWSEYDAAEFEVVPLIGPTRTCMLPTPRQLWGHCTRAEPVCLPTTPLATHRWWLHDDDRLVALPPRGGRTPLSSTPPSKPSSPPSRPIRLDCSMPVRLSVVRVGLWRVRMSCQIRTADYAGYKLYGYIM